MKKADFKIDCTGDVVTGNTILFEEAVFGGNHRKPIFRGTSTLMAEVIG